jgi:DNA-binding GntR family transcriptional regulator
MLNSGIQMDAVMAKSARKSFGQHVTDPEKRPELRASSASRAESVYGAIREEISTGVLKAGTRMREIDLAEHYGVSRTPIREALKRLAVDGLVEDLPGEGLIVSNPSLNEVLDAYLIREVLEGLAARLATERAHDTDRMQIQAAMRHMRLMMGAGDLEGAIKLCNAFDDLMNHAAKSERLHRMIRTARASQGPSLRSNIRTPGRLDQAIAERLLIYEAFEARDAAGAEAATKDHLRKARELRLATSLENTLGGNHS